MDGTTGQAEPPSDTLGGRVRGRRRELELRQQELANLAGVSIRFVHSLEHDKASTWLDKVLDVLGLELKIRVRR